MTTASEILKEVDEALGAVGVCQVQTLEDEILSAKHIFLAGAGRSGLMSKAFANRLMHLGFSASVVGDVTSPHSMSGGLLLVGSGSGETASLAGQAAQAKKANMRVALITTNPLSTIAGLADAVVTIPAQSKTSAEESMQPMGSTFEQASLVLYDAMAVDLMGKTGQTEKDLSGRHADIE